MSKGKKVWVLPFCLGIYSVAIRVVNQSRSIKETGRKQKQRFWTKSSSSSQGIPLLNAGPGKGSKRSMSRLDRQIL